MKAILLCTQGNYLYPIYDKKIIDYSIDLLASFGIKEVIIIISNFTENVSSLISHIDNNYNLNIVYKYTKNIKDIVYNIEISKRLISNEDFVLMDANNIFLDKVKLNKPPFIYISSSSNPENFNVIEFYGEHIKNIEVKPDNPKSRMVDTSLAVYPNKIFEVILKLKNKQKVTITNINNYYASQLGYDIVDNWFCLMSPESFYAATHKKRLECHKI